MSDSAPSNALEVSVTELSSKLKRTVEDTFGHVRVRGEISGFRGPHSSGHCYFSLKDERARLEAVIWRGQAAKLRHMPEEGLEVIASGKLTTYPGSSKYQIVIDDLEPAGAGALMALLEERRKKLAAEGLFDDARKQLVPFMPKVIGVITSPTGAVIRDILHRIADRFPVHVIVWPVRVQGESTGPEVANGIHRFNTLPEDGPIARPDVIIVARGGGSLEDLWGFNDEALVRAAANSMIPLISAVGHETDWTLIDYASDWRAPTPTAAAERAVPVKAELEATLADLGARLRGSMSRLSETRRNHLRAAMRGLQSPDMLLALPRRRFDEAAGRLGRALSGRVEKQSLRFAQSRSRLNPHLLTRKLTQSNERLKPMAERHARSLAGMMQARRARFDASAARVSPLRIATSIASARRELEVQKTQMRAGLDARLQNARQRLNSNARVLESVSYTSVLARGFAVIRDHENRPINRVAGLNPADLLNVQMQDGSVLVTVTGETGAEPKSPSKPAARPQKAPSHKTQKPPEGQGQLF